MRIASLAPTPTQSTNNIERPDAGRSAPRFWYTHHGALVFLCLIFILWCKKMDKSAYVRSGEQTVAESHSK